VLNFRLLLRAQPLQGQRRSAGSRAQWPACPATAAGDTFQCKVTPHDSAPFDGAEVRWSPVRRADKDLSSDGLKLTVRLPGRKDHDIFRPAAKDNATGRYPVNREELPRKVAPCVVHMLDAYFSSLVMERLAAVDVRHFIGVHDCWLIPAFVHGPERGRDVLEWAIHSAGEEWLQGLGPVYDRLSYYLGSDPKFGRFARDIKAKWETRVHDGRWPEFRAVPPSIHFSREMQPQPWTADDRSLAEALQMQRSYEREDTWRSLERKFRNSTGQDEGLLGRSEVT